MNQDKIDRINQLARKSRQEGLSEAEKAEQHQLRQEYIQSFRESMQSALEKVYIEDENGNHVPVTQRRAPTLPLS